MNKPLEAGERFNQGNPIRRKQLLWLEFIKAFALIWIFLNHLVENLFGYPYIANPSVDWPPLADRLAPLYALSGQGLLDIPIALIRDIGWFGDQGVQLCAFKAWRFLSPPGKPDLSLMVGDAYPYPDCAYPPWWEPVVKKPCFLFKHDGYPIYLRSVLLYSACLVVRRPDHPALSDLSAPVGRSTTAGAIVATSSKLRHSFFGPGAWPIVLH
jgi:hypothetical protein